METINIMRICYLHALSQRPGRRPEASSRRSQFPSLFRLRPSERDPGLLLADSSRLPLPVTTFVASAGEGEYITTDALPAESVYCDTPIPTSACGLPIYVHGIHHHAPLELGRSTLGGIIKAMSRNGKKEALYGLTVAHAFTDVFQIQTQEDSEGDSELSFEGDLYMDGEDVRHVGIQEGQIIIPYCLSQLTFF